MMLVVAVTELQIAVDFVSPESVATCMAQRQQLRALDMALGEPTLQGQVRRRRGDVAVGAGHCLS
jgi:hypothetical protein